MNAAAELKSGMKLEDFLRDHTTTDLSKLLLSLAAACTSIARMINNAGISDILGVTGTTNVQGEHQQKLDDISNQVLMDYLQQSGVCAGYLSEENDDIVTLSPDGKFILSIDPLDGSSNIDVVAPIGTIFNVVERLSKPGEVTNEDFLQVGDATKAAGYVIYGSSTILLFSTGNGVHGFTLNTEDSEYYLSHPNITTPAEGKIYSINQGNACKFGEEVQGFLNYCGENDKATSRPYSLRYIGSMVADLHRNLLKGGIFIYPATKSEPKGKLRLLYECIPMGYLVEQAGGKATDGYGRILEIQPTEVHERTPIYIGSTAMVNKALEFIKD
jgi:fructose-1,6-bisphosphatase I